MITTSETESGGRLGLFLTLLLTAFLCTCGLAQTVDYSAYTIPAELKANAASVVRFTRITG